jgi:hypothetical protein
MQSRGHKVIVPSLLDALNHRSNFARAISKAIRNQIQMQVIPGPIYLVLHSAAGAFVTAIREAVTAKLAGYIFVDARLPKDGASLSDEDASEAVEQRLVMVREGLLPRWSDWYSPEVMREVLPDDEIRGHFLEELRPIPVGLFEERLKIRAGWPEAICGYICLSEFYKPLAERARAEGWPVIEREVGHLYMLVRPNEIVELILEMTHKMKQRDQSSGTGVFSE